MAVMSSSLRELRNIVDETIAVNVTIAPSQMMMLDHQIPSTGFNVQPQCKPKPVAPKIINNWTTPEEEIILSGYLSHEFKDEIEFYQPLKFNKMIDFNRDAHTVLLSGECMNITIIYRYVVPSDGYTRRLEIKVDTTEGRFIAYTYECEVRGNDESKRECINILGNNMPVRKNKRVFKHVAAIVETFQIKTNKCTENKCYKWSITYRPDIKVFG